MDTKVTRLSDTTWAFEQGMVRCFYIAGNDRAILLDTGVKPENLFPLMMPLADLPLTVINTHGHGDHTANNGLFPTIHAHPMEESVLTADGAVPYVIKPVNEGDTFELGGVTLEVVHTPGHTPGSICLLDRANRVLYSGDTVSHGPVFMMSTLGCDVDAYGASLRRLQAMAAEGVFDTVYCCHSDCPIGVEVIDELLAALEGALNGTIPGVAAQGHGPMGSMTTYSYGKSGLYLTL